MFQDRYARELQYIHEYWDQIIFTHPNRIVSWRNMIMKIGNIRLPEPIVSPNHSYFAGTQFYWDSYFMLLGIYDDKRIITARSLIDNQQYIFKKFGVMLARNSITSLGRTQPPFFTSMVKELEANDKTVTKSQVDAAYKVAEHEYRQVWSTSRRYNADVGLSCYHPKFMPKLLQTFESGWDISSRFQTAVYPIDLNCLLYKYEEDFENHAKNRKHTGKQEYWRKRKEVRKQAINTYLWNEESGYYYDYEIQPDAQSSLITVAGLFALWCGAASEKQAKACVGMLKKLEFDGGLASTEKLPWQGRQWDYPNGWAPLQLIAVEGLLRYGYIDEAHRIGGKWLALNSKIFNQTGKFWEKYNVVNGRIGLPGRYPTMEGFGWTNAVFSRLCKLLDANPQRPS